MSTPKNVVPEVFPVKIKNYLLQIPTTKKKLQSNFSFLGDGIPKNSVESVSQWISFICIDLDL